MVRILVIQTVPLGLEVWISTFVAGSGADLSDVLVADHAATEEDTCLGVARGDAITDDVRKGLLKLHDRQAKKASECRVRHWLAIEHEFAAVL